MPFNLQKCVFPKHFRDTVSECCHEIFLLAPFFYEEMLSFRALLATQEAYHPRATGLLGHDTNAVTMLAASEYKEIQHHALLLSESHFEA